MNAAHNADQPGTRQFTFDIRSLGSKSHESTRRTALFTGGIAATMISFAAILLARMLASLHSLGDSSLAYQFVLLVLAISIGIYFAFITRLASARGPDIVCVDDVGVHFFYPNRPVRTLRWNKPHIRILIADYRAYSSTVDDPDLGITWRSPAPPLVPLTHEAMGAILSVARSLGLAVSSRDFPHPASGAPHTRWTITSRRAGIRLSGQADRAMNAG